jgi:hypothetical protein
MPNYQKSKIYMIIPYNQSEEGDIYIGSTTRPLSERMNEHRCRAKENKLCKSKVLFDKYGAENLKIELIENYPCDNKEKLSSREGLFQRKMKCVNKAVAGRQLWEYNSIYYTDEVKKRKAVQLFNRRLFRKELSYYTI